MIVKTLALMAALCGAWLLVQRLWLRAEGPDTEQADALAGRSGCHNCTCDGASCAREQHNPETREVDDHAPGRL